MRISTATTRLALAGALAASALGTAACGSTSSGAGNAGSASSQVSPAVSSAVSAAMAPVTAFPDPTGHVKPPAGKKIVAITCSSQGYGCVQGAIGVQSAGRMLGWNVTVVDGKGDPSVWNSAVQQAVVSRADGIVLLAVNPALVQGALAKAKAAGIPVEEVFIPKFSGPSVDGYVTTDHVQGGKILADWIIKDSAGKANILMLNEPEFPELVQRNNALLAELKANCPGCNVVDTVQLNIGTMAQQLAGAVTSSLQTHPNVGYVVAPFDSAGIFAAQGIRQAGKSSQVKLAGAEGDPNGIQGVQGGTQAVDLATVPPWGGWAAMDLLARHFAGDPITIEALPQRLLNKSNVPSGKGWTGDVNYQAKFAAIWGR
jgi:ribose transport system substrate-binding protein